MTRKDYIAFAERFKAEKPADPPYGNFGDTTYFAANGVWCRMVQSAADTFAADNSRFDRSRFLQAAGLLDLTN